MRSNRDVNDMLVAVADCAQAGADTLSVTWRAAITYAGASIDGERMGAGTRRTHHRSRRCEAL